MKGWGIALICCFLIGCSATTATNVTDVPQRPLGLPKRLIIPDDFVPKDVHIVALGDSLTEGVGDTNGGYVVDVKEKLLQHKAVRSVMVTNLGKRGLRISQLDKVITKHEQSMKDADMIFITIGGNDVMEIVRSHLFDLTYSLFVQKQKTFAQKLDHLIWKLRSLNRNATIVLIGLYNPFANSLQTIPEIDDVIVMWNKGSRDVLSRYERTMFVDVKDIFDDRDDLLYDDQFHPNEQGYAFIAMRVYEQLARSMEK
ncbi:GDSL-type esterase/lipase family protein [Anoxybacteroides amylolyticum]|uniref:GDSL-like Lipase/Acylhydrolase family protein n=1 Tax=Anoxybacteroides amylolyticum TaxID=294699 RepID=A0A167TE86_9BACL|nr:GDSL-type esterase/lipase family protein [Anoxybacillus amylolyticus]ANB60324.1 GDSL-like Lipase/Acylhydrolase family protein [Anoxybacillus amylolyticus]